MNSMSSRTRATAEGPRALQRWQSSDGRWRPLALWAGMSATTALLATLLVPAAAAPASAVTKEPPTPDLGTVVAGADARTRAPELPEVPVVSAAGQKLPAGGSATVPVASASATESTRTAATSTAAPTVVGGLPVAVRQSGGTKAEKVSVRVRQGSLGAPVVELRLPEAASSSGTKTATGTTSPAAVDVELDYSKFAGAYGGSYGDRLALTGKNGKLVQFVNDTENQTLTAHKVKLSAASATTLVVAATTSGGEGDFGATPLAKSASWSTDLRSGSFSWNYPIAVPDVPGSFTPQLGLSYNSGGIDGRTSNTNNQSSLVGDGFDLWPGFIERKYKACSMDDVKNDAGRAIGDQCWDYDNAHISFNGAAGELIPAGTNTWKLSKDDGTKVELLTDSARSNGDNNNEYWRVTTPEGVQYYFGYHRLPGYASGDSVTHSTWTVPVLGDDAGDPCHASTRAASICDQAWRWNLDYAVDPSGNAISYYYTKGTNYYGKLGDPANNADYIRGGTLSRIDYGLASGDVSGATPLARVSFGYEERCIPGEVAGFPCDSISTQPNGWFDTPWDLNCSSTGTCDNGRTSPSFWGRKRMTSITTNVHLNGAFTPVDNWELKHRWGTADVDYQLLLKSITRTGKTGHATDTSLAGDVTLPPVTFSYEQLANRLDDTGDGQAPFVKERLATIVDESGGQVDVGYSQPACQVGNLPVENNNDTRCFPQRRLPGAELSPVTDWFNKYVVTSTVTTDLTGGAPDSETRYQYLGGGAWHWDDSNGITPDEEKTWSDWRGYGHVRTTSGSPTQQYSQSDSWFLRGMHGDRSNRSGGTRSVTVELETGEGDPITDSDWLAGYAYKTAQYSGVGGAIVSKAVNRPWWHRTGIKERTWGTIRSGFSGTSQTRTFTSLGTGGAPWRETLTETTYDADVAAEGDIVAGRVVEITERGDINESGDEKCTKIKYATNPDLNILTLHRRNQTWAVRCDQTPDREAGEVINDARYAYDGSGYTGWPREGRMTRTADLIGYDGTTAKYVEASSTYDAYGRVTKVTDLSADVTAPSYGDGTLVRAARTDGRATTTSYTPATGFMTSMTETTPPADPAVATSALTTTTKVDPRRGTPTVVTDANGYTTVVFSDALGRTGKVWLADRATTQLPSMKYTYRIIDGEPAAVGATVLNDQGEQRTSWTIYDGMLRERQTQVPGPSGGRIIADRFYDARGLNYKSYLDYYNDQAPAAAIFDPYESSSVDTMIRTDFDGLGRSIETRTSYTDSDSPANILDTTRWKYRGDRTTTIPPQGGTATTTLVDALGRTTQIRRHTDRAGAGPDDTSGFDTTSYTYTRRGELASVTDPEQNTWTYRYDQRGREVSTTDPDAGTTSTTYDDRGQVVTVKDGADKVTWNKYDGLGRPTELRTNNATGTLLKSWTYDTVPGAKGQLASSTSYSGSNAYKTLIGDYDRLYRPLRTVTQIPESEGDLAGNYITAAAYTVSGNLLGQPMASLSGSQDSLGIVYTRDSYTGWVTGTSAINGVEAEHTYDYVGKLMQTEMYGATGKSLWATNTYEDGTNRLSTYRIDRLDQPGVDRHETYEYDDLGNILSLTDVSRTGTDVQCFRYDHLAQLTAAWAQDTAGCANSGAAAESAGLLGGPAPYWHRWTYDEAGSRLTEIQEGIAGTATPADVNRTYGYDAAQPHTATSVNQSAEAAGGSPAVDSVENYTYDAVGRTTSRQISGDTQHLTWGDDGRLSKVENADGSTTQYVYDAEGNRLVGRSTDTSGKTTATLYLGNVEYTATSTSPGTTTRTQYIDLGDGHMAVVENGGKTTFTLADHHGTGQLTVNAADLSQVAQRRTTPFGTERGTGSLTPEQWPGTRGFVGGLDDRETTGLISLGAREYDPGLGRFISLDPVMDLTDPTQMHGYAYASNNPTTVSDATGLCDLGAGHDCTSDPCAGATSCIPEGSDERECYTAQACDDFPGSTPVGPGVGGGTTTTTTGGGTTGGTAADGAGTTGPAATGPTEEEIAHAREVMDKSVADVAMELGFELLKEFIGYNDFMGCLGGDIAGCAWLIAGITPWGKGVKAIKAAWKIVEGVQAFYKTLDKARGVVAAAKATKKTKSHVLWTGGDVSKDAARAYAEANGAKTLEMTATGRVLEKLPSGRVTNWLWGRASARFARGAKGDVHVFFNRNAPPRPGSVYARVERPILVEQGNRIVPHMVG
ncbi:RHS repeat-associated core domain-containing protein [Myceligenerans crystallogenes]